MLIFYLFFLLFLFFLYFLINSSTIKFNFLINSSTNKFLKYLKYFKDYNVFCFIFTWFVLVLCNIYLMYYYSILVDKYLLIYIKFARRLAEEGHTAAARLAAAGDLNFENSKTLLENSLLKFTPNTEFHVFYWNNVSVFFTCNYYLFLVTLFLFFLLLHSYMCLLYSEGIIKNPKWFFLNNHTNENIINFIIPERKLAFRGLPGKDLYF